MARLAGPRGPLGRPQVRTLGPAGTAVALVAAIPLLLLGMLAMVFALVFARGRGGVFVKTFGMPGPVPPGGPVPPREPAAPVADAVADADAPAAAAPAPAAKRGKSFAEVVEAWPLVLALSLLAGAFGAGEARARLLVPMDDAQTNHLKAYGLTFWVLQQGQKAEWLLNYRGGSFLLADDPATEREANIRGVALEPVGGSAEAASTESTVRVRAAAAGISAPAAG